MYILSKLKNKSSENIEAADILNKNGLFSSSVHCSYYSCYQLMEHFLLRETLRNQFDEFRRNNRNPPHSCYQLMQHFLLRKELKNKFDKFEKNKNKSSHSLLSTYGTFFVRKNIKRTI